MSSIRLVAFEDGGRTQLGHRVLPILGLRPGYKHITLRNESGQPLGLASLFVHIKVLLSGLREGGMGAKGSGDCARWV